MRSFRQIGRLYGIEGCRSPVGRTFFRVELMPRSFLTWLALSILAIGATGCRATNNFERYGKTFFVDGAGNWGDGGSELARGLRAAGYRGDVEEYIWTTSFNPLIDQLNIVAAKVRAAALTRKIQAYRQRFPDIEVNIVALSAGTGVATWAVEQLDDRSRINHLFLMGSSLSHDYKISQALGHMTGNIYVYHSPHDSVLERVRVIGTIDGLRGVDSVGLVGLTAPKGMEDRIINTAWSREWLQYGWTGAHSDCTNANFVRHEVGRHIVHDQPLPATRLASDSAAPILLTSAPAPFQ